MVLLSRVITDTEELFGTTPQSKAHGFEVAMNNISQKKPEQGNHILAPAMNCTDSNQFPQLTEIYTFLKAACKLRSKVFKSFILLRVRFLTVQYSL
jgi:hypothetical protein